ncbi:hypothetical protein Pint_35101 [Pistacia integerrima]|uniref:Uncharacterized protein n=1 Tax=Pistacia integerrima TaxID=434235 RepID=A0ACC0Y081_9ROSI|nr:hypothetical protein Pint_35101 [Pistacia integerrima]
MLTHRAMASSPLHPVVSFDCHSQFSYQSLFPHNFNYGFSKASRKFKASRLKANFWDSIRSG